MAMQPFQAESKKLMDLMINSIYTNKEIFLRELISNASDAIDKLYFKSLTDTSVGMDREDFRILLTLDKDARMLTVSDNGIGMTREELEQNLGTIAHSGSQDFKAENVDENIDIIGQFGVGFYSAFMVADRVTVISKAYGSDQAWQWESSGVEGYEITPAEKETAGTDIILHIKPNTTPTTTTTMCPSTAWPPSSRSTATTSATPSRWSAPRAARSPNPIPSPRTTSPSGRSTPSWRP